MRALIACAFAALLAACSSGQVYEFFGQDCASEISDAVEGCKDDLSQREAGDLVDLLGTQTKRQADPEAAAAE